MYEIDRAIISWNHNECLITSSIIQHVSVISIFLSQLKMMNYSHCCRWVTQGILKGLHVFYLTDLLSCVIICIYQGVLQFALAEVDIRRGLKSDGPRARELILRALKVLCGQIESQKFATAKMRLVSFFYFGMKQLGYLCGQFSKCHQKNELFVLAKITPKYKLSTFNKWQETVTRYGSYGDLQKDRLLKLK